MSLNKSAKLKIASILLIIALLSLTAFFVSGINNSNSYDLDELSADSINNTITIDFNNLETKTIYLDLEKQNYSKAEIDITGLYLNSTYPLNPSLDILNDGITDWNYSGEFSTTETINFLDILISYIEQCGLYPCNVPFVLSSETIGKLRLNNLILEYNKLKQSNTKTILECNETEICINETTVDCDYPIETICNETCSPICSEVCVNKTINITTNLTSLDCPTTKQCNNYCKDYCRNNKQCNETCTQKGGKEVCKLKCEKTKDCRDRCKLDCLDNCTNVTVQNITQNITLECGEVCIDNCTLTDCVNKTIENCTQTINENCTTELVCINKTINITQENITQEVELKQVYAVIGKPVKWEKIVKFGLKNNITIDNLTIDIPENIENYSVKKKEYKKQVRKAIKAKLKDLKKAGTQTTKESDSSPKKQKKKTNKIDPKKPKMADEPAAEEPTAEPITNTETNLTLEINETLKDQDEVIIEYYTKAPNANETIISANSKQVVVYSSDSLHYTNITAFTNLTTEVADISLIKIYNIVNNTKTEVSFTAYDLNNNSLYDYVEWIVPHLSEQIYEIIVITKAIHLDSNYTFISDIYDYVKAKDNNWSEIIYPGEYVRVTFEQNLTNTKDITIYARSNNTANIEVFLENDNKTLAVFNNIQNESTYKIYLTNLTNSSSTFDLKILDSPVEFDYIVDPSFYILYNGTSYEDVYHNRTEESEHGIRLHAPVLFMDFNERHEGNLSSYALEFGGGNEFVNVGNVGNVNTISYWIYSNDNDEFVMDLGAVISIVRNAYPLAVVSPTVYVDGEAKTLLGSEKFSNTGFETWSGGDPSNWGDSNGDSIQETTEVYAGSNSNKFDNSANQGSVSQSKATTIGTVYAVSAFVKAGSTGATRVGLADSSGVQKCWQQLSYTLTGSWTKSEVLCAATTNPSFGGFYVRWGSDKYHYFDTASFKQVSLSTSGGKWHHVAITTSTAINANDVDFGYVGNMDNATDGDHYFTGTLDEIAMWDRVLTAAEVLDLNNSGAGMYVTSDKVFPSTGTSMGQNLVSVWHFDDGAGTTLTDSEGSKSGTLTNMEAGDWVAGRVLPDPAHVQDKSIYNNYGNILNTTLEPNYNSSCTSPISDGGGCYEFDGVDDYIQTTITQEKNTTALWYKKYTSSSWTHVVSLGNGTNYTNGTKGNPSNFPVFASGDTIKIGMIDASTYFNGSIDQVQIWNRSLTPQEIKELYNGSLHGMNNSEFIGKYARKGIYKSLIFYNDTSRYWNLTFDMADTTSNRTGVVNSTGINTSHDNLVSYWTFDGTYDDAVGGNDGNVTGTQNSTGISSGAIYFDGEGDLINITEIDSLYSSQSWWQMNQSELVWHHYANVSGTTYKDGVLGNLDGFPLRNDTNVIIGEKHNGSIDEVLIYNTSLTAAEVKDLYKAGLSQHANTNITLETRTASNYNVSDSGLVSFWSFNDGNANDEHGLKRNNGTVSGATWSEENGTVGGGYDFDGVDDYISVSDDNSLDFGNSVDDIPLTISAWVNMRDATKFRLVFKRDDDPAPDLRELMFGTGSDDKLHLYIFDDFNVYEGRSYDTALTSYENEWIHLVATYDGSGGTSASDGIDLYLNGVVVDDNTLEAGSYDSMHDRGIPLEIGRFDDDTDSYAKGSIDEVRIYNRSLSAAEIQNLYELGDYHIQWNAWDDEGLITDDSVDSSTSQGKFYQYKAHLNTNDTSVSPYLLNHSLGFVPDASGPTLTLLYPTAGNYSTNVTVLNYTVTDGSGLSHCWYSLDNGATNSSIDATCANYTGLTSADGSHTWVIYANDTLGYLSLVDVNFTVDTIYPSITFNRTTNANLSYSNNFTVSVNASDTNQHYVVNDLDDTIKGWWRFENFNDTHTYDEKKNNNGTINGPNLTDSGKFGKAYSFISSNDYIALPAGIYNNPSEFSYSFWMYPINANANFAYCYDNSGDNLYLYAYLSDTYFNGMEVNIKGSTGGKLYPNTTNITSNLNQWYHIVVTAVEGGNANLYINGELSCETTTDGWVHHVSVSNQHYIGTRSYSGFSSFNGTIDEFIIYNRSLSAKEINASYLANLYRYETNFSSEQLSDGNHTFKAYVVDTAGNLNSTNTRTVTLDTTYPQISYGSNTKNTSSNVTDNWIFVNVTITETNRNTTSFTLYNSTQTINTTTFPNVTNELNFTNLADGTYYFNVSVNDSAGNTNTTTSRATTLDNVIPSITFNRTTTANLSYSNNFTVSINTSDTNQHYVVNDLDNSIVGWYRFENFNSTHTYDEKKKNNGTLQGPTLTDSGRFGKAYSFDGSDDYIDLGTQDSLNITGALTVSAWVKTTTTSDAIASRYDNGANRRAWMLWVGGGANAGTMQFYVASDGTVGTTINCKSAAYNDDNWHHIVGVYVPSSSIKIYVDGNLEETDTVSVPASLYGGSQNTLIGAHTSSGAATNQFAGSIDEVILYNRSLSAEEINASYLANLYRYETNFSSEQLSDGNHTFKAYVVDTAGNLNSTPTRTVTLDTTYPQISYGSNVKNTTSNVTDNWIFVNVSLTEINLANITYTLFNHTGVVNESIYTTNTTTTINWTSLPDNNYTYVVNITDKAKQTNTTGTRVITLDNTNPSATLSTPTNNTRQNSKTQNLTASVTDNIGIKNATLYLFNSTGLNQTFFITDFYENILSRTIGISLNLKDGIYNWSYLIYDWTGNSFVSVNNSVTIDTVYPSITNVIYSPNSARLIDPNVLLSVNATVTDASTEVNSTILQYFNGTGWNNATMTLIENNIYQANITLADINASYTINVFANDSVNNFNQSSNQSFDSVWDCTWNLTPSTMTPAAAWSVNKWIGNLSINNTGDSDYHVSNCNLDFRLDYNITEGRIYVDDDYIKPSETYTVSADSNQTIQLNATFLTEVKSEKVAVTIDEIRSRSPVEARNITVTLVSNQQGPYLAQEIHDYPITVDLTSGNITLKGRIRNLMGSATLNETNTAYNVSFNFTLPTGFVNVSTNLSTSYTNLTDNTWNVITVNATFDDLETATPGTQTFYLYGYGYNITDSLIKDANNKTLLNNSVSITFLCYNASDDVCVAACGNTLDSDCTEAATTTVVTTTTDTPTSGGSSSGVTSSSGSSYVEKLLQTEELYELVRGEQNNFLLQVENPFEDSILNNISIEITGFLSQYLSVDPYMINGIHYNESDNFTIWISAPKYFTKGTYELNFQITAWIDTESKTNITWTSRKRLNENRLVILDIHEVSRDSADKYLGEINSIITELDSNEFNTKYLKELLEKANNSFTKKDYEKVKELYDEIKLNRDNAFTSYEIMNEVQERINISLSKGVVLSKTERLLSLARSAFERGDYATALERADDAKITYALESVGLRPITFIKNNWAWVILALFILSIKGYVLYLFSKLNIVKSRLKALRKEEGVILGLIKEIQKETFKQGTMNMNEYTESLMHYEKRMNQIIQNTIKLETIKVNLFKITKTAKERLLEERNKLLVLIKDTQSLYLKTGRIETRVYQNRMKSYAERFAEIEEKLADLETQKAMKAMKKKFFNINIKKLFTGRYKKEIMSSLPLPPKAPSKLIFNSKGIITNLPVPRPPARMRFKNLFIFKKKDIIADMPPPPKAPVKIENKALFSSKEITTLPALPKLKPKKTSARTQMNILDSIKLFLAKLKLPKFTSKQITKKKLPPLPKLPSPPTQVPPRSGTLRSKSDSTLTKPFSIKELLLKYYKPITGIFALILFTIASYSILNQIFNNNRVDETLRYLTPAVTYKPIITFLTLILVILIYILIIFIKKEVKKNK